MGRALAALGVAAAVLALVFSGNGRTVHAQVCVGLEPFGFITYEAYDNVATYTTAIELAAAGQAVLFPATPSGEAHGLEYPGLLVGPQEARLEQEPNTALRVPPTLMKAIVWIETSFQHAHTDTPWGGVGSVVRSFDCGFGLGQITTGMENYTGNASVGQALVGTHFLFNVAESARLLAEKWNSEFVPVTGRGDPAALEDWYHVLWGYNGLAALNHPLFQTDHEFDWLDHPLHPWRDPLRGEVYHCRDEAAPTWIDSGDGTPWYDYGDYTYPERIYGCLRHPPEYPSRVLESREFSAVPLQNGVPRMWQPLHANMPDLDIPEVAAAFSPTVFISCEDNGFAGGCPAMEFPTSFPELSIETHQDPTPPANPRALAALLGAPILRISGPDEVGLGPRPNGSPGNARIVVQNAGTWIAPFRVWTSAPWITVLHDGYGDHIHGGVAVGAETKVVILAETESRREVAKQGHTATLVITLDRDELPAGDVEGTVVIEPLFGEGETRAVLVRAGAQVDARGYYEIENPRPDRIDEEPPEGEPIRHRIVIPGVASDP